MNLFEETYYRKKMIYNKIAYKMVCANQGKSVMLINNKLHNGGQPANVIIYNSVTFFCKTQGICVSQES